MNRFPFLTVVLSACLLLVFGVLGSPLSAQSTDPFGGGDNPFEAPAAKQPKAAQPKAIKTQRLKAAINRGNPIQLTGEVDDEAERRIKAALNDETTQIFVETPLGEAIATTSRLHDIPIVIDNLALQEIGLDPDVGVNIDLKNVSLRSFLRLMLRDLDLTYLIKDQVMQITTKEAAEENLVTEIYQLPDNVAKKSPQIMTIIQSHIQPDTWEVLGGTSVISELDHLLIVSTTSDVHDQVEAFLNRLVSKYGK